jgi:hypothetical protein
MRQVFTQDDDAGQIYPVYWKRRKLRLNLLLVAACGSLFAAKPPNGMSPFIPDGNTPQQVGAGVPASPGAGRSVPGEPQAGRSLPSAPSRVVFQSAITTTNFPVCFTNPPGAAVQTIMLSTRADAADLATLVDAPETARIRVAQDDGWTLPEMSAVEQSLTAQFVPAQWLVAEVDFEQPVPLDSLRFGDTAGRPEWGRRWLGEIKGVVCFDAPPGADVRAGAASWLAVRGKFGGYPSTHAQRQAAVEAGLNYGVDWATVIIIR